MLDFTTNLCFTGFYSYFPQYILNNLNILNKFCLFVTIIVYLHLFEVFSCIYSRIFCLMSSMLVGCLLWRRSRRVGQTQLVTMMMTNLLTIHRGLGQTEITVTRRYDIIEIIIFILDGALFRSCMVVYKIQSLPFKGGLLPSTAGH